MYFSHFQAMHWCSRVFFGLMLCLAYARNYVMAQDDLRRRYEAEAESKWNMYIKFATRLQGRVETVRKDHQANDKIIDHEWVEYKHKQNLRLQIEQRVFPKTNGDCWAKNEKYAFALIRKKESSPWIPTRIDDVLNDGKDIPYVKTFFDGDDYRNVCSLLFIGDAWLPELNKKPGFHIRKLERAEQKDLELLRLDFSNTPTDEEIKDKKFRPVKGWIVLAPDQFWRVCEYEMEAVWPAGDAAIAHGKVDCRINKDGYPIFTKLVERIRGIQGPLKKSRIDHMLTEEAVIEERDPSSEEFTLSAFGLPEPPAVRVPSRWHLWVALAGLLCLGTYFFLRSRSKRLKV